MSNIVFQAFLKPGYVQIQKFEFDEDAETYPGEEQVLAAVDLTTTEEATALLEEFGWTLDGAWEYNRVVVLPDFDPENECWD